MSAPEPRHVVVVDAETSALSPSTSVGGLFGGPVGTWGEITELAWWNLSTGEHGRFVPSHHSENVRSHGEAQALIVSRYLERLVDEPHDKGPEVKRLHAQLVGNTIAGASPGFDVKFLRPLFKRNLLDVEPFHHRWLDVSVYAAGYFRLLGRELPGLAEVVRLVNEAGLASIEPPDHTAEGDVRATGEALIALGAVERS